MFVPNASIFKLDDDQMVKDQVTHKRHVILSGTEWRDTAVTFPSAKQKRCSALWSVSTLFMVVGDWGGRGRKPYRTAISEQVGISLGEVSTKLMPRFIISPGDCFYPHGPKKAGDVRFRETFEVCHVSFVLLEPIQS